MSFGDYLQQFVNTVDIVNDHIKEAILAKIQSYLTEQIDVSFFTFLIENTIQMGSKSLPGLITTGWMYGGQTTSTPLKDENGNYMGQVSLAFSINEPMWIVSPKKSSLRKSTQYKDLLGNADPSIIPPYVRKTSHEIHTSIIIPVKKDGEEKTFGVINFESTQYLRKNLKILAELQKIASSIAKLHVQNFTYNILRNNTLTALRSFPEFRDDDFNELRSSKEIFVATASRNRSSLDVIGAIRDILGSYEHRIKPIYWEEFSESGNVCQIILDTIKKCDYGICYLSEIVEDTGDSLRYDDSPNVLMEAGMLSACSESFENWIPIREKNSLKRIPFDIRTNQILCVPRDERGELNEAKFTLALRARLNVWLPGEYG